MTEPQSLRGAKPGHFLTVWSIVLLRATFVKQDMGRAAFAGAWKRTSIENSGPCPICGAHVDNK
jgi:hypothetical protein